MSHELRVMSKKDLETEVVQSFRVCSLQLLTHSSKLVTHNSEGPRE